MKGEGCVELESGLRPDQRLPDWVRRALYWLFCVSPWASMLSRVRAWIVVLSLTILRSCESFPVHLWFVSRYNTGRDRLVAVTCARFFLRGNQATAEDPFRSA
jgi:hypothetical protein